MSRDSFTDYYAPLLESTYDVVDRIVINAYYGFAHSPGGFRQWWRDLHNGDETNLDDTHLMRMAGRFSRRVRGWAKKNDIPVIDCKKGQRKHLIAEEHMPKDPDFHGIFAVMVSRMPAPVWRVLRFESGGFHIKRKDPMPHVNHYFFHIIDKDWGHVTIAVCGHPPFRAMIMLNGHEYTACKARHMGIGFQKEGNCFTEVSDTKSLAEAADSLRSKNAIGRLRQVCDRWSYRCLCFGLSFEEQKRSRFCYSYSVYQMEYSRNLLFKNGRRMEQVFDGVIDRSRTRLDIGRVLKIFGRKNRRFKKRLQANHREEVVLETPKYDLTVFKVHFGNLTLKIYTKGECVLRCEAIAHNVKELRCGKIIEKFGEMIEKLSELLTRFLDNLQCADMAWLDHGQLDDLSSPGMVGNTRVGGVDLNRPRMRFAMDAVLGLALSPQGFTASEHAAKFRELQGLAPEQYTPRQSAYDLKKLRGKGLVEKTSKHGRHYRPTPEGLRTMSGMIVLREKVLKPLLQYKGRCKPGSHPRVTADIDGEYRQTQRKLQYLLKRLNFVA